MQHSFSARERMIGPQGHKWYWVGDTSTYSTMCGRLFRNGVGHQELLTTQQLDLPSFCLESTPYYGCLTSR